MGRHQEGHFSLVVLHQEGRFSLVDRQDHRLEGLRLVGRCALVDHLKMDRLWKVPVDLRSVMDQGGLREMGRADRLLMD